MGTCTMLTSPLKAYVTKPENRSERERERKRRHGQQGTQIRGMPLLTLLSLADAGLAWQECDPEMCG